MIASSSRAVELTDARQFDRDGFLVVSDVLGSVECEALSVELSNLFRQQQDSSTRKMGGLRNVLRLSPLARKAAGSPQVVSLVAGLLGQKAFPVRAIFFDKQPQANWSVPWHQDLAIAVAERIDAPGFGPWSVKDGVVQVQPPTHILAEMITVRLHLDECSADNGALRVIPRSHRRGELRSAEITEWTERQGSVVCEVPRGGVLVMRPLLLHASSPAKVPSHRRVLHVEYAAQALPNGLMWAEQS